MKYVIYNHRSGALVTSINKTKFYQVLSYRYYYNIFNSRQITKNPMEFSLKAARKFIELNWRCRYNYKIRPV